MRSREKRYGEKCFIRNVTLQMSAGSPESRSWERHLCVSHGWVAGTQVLGQLSATFQSVLAGSWSPEHMSQTTS